MFCSSCGNQVEPVARFCSSCGVPCCGPTTPPPFGGTYPVRGQLVRSRNSRIIAGVCAGFAEHYGWDLNLVRIITVVITLFTVMPLFAYLAAWVIIPDGQYALPIPPPPPPPQAPSPSESPVT